MDNELEAFQPSQYKSTHLHTAGVLPNNGQGTNGDTLGHVTLMVDWNACEMIHTFIIW